MLPVFGPVMLVFLACTTTTTTTLLQSCQLAKRTPPDDHAPTLPYPTPQFEKQNRFSHPGGMAVMVGKQERGHQQDMLHLGVSLIGTLSTVIHGVKPEEGCMVSHFY